VGLIRRRHDSPEIVMPPLAYRLLRLCGHIPVPRVRGAVWYLYNSLGLSLSVAFETNFHGFRYRGRLDDLIDWNVFFFGSYCPEELDFLAVAAKVMKGSTGGTVYVDVGANVGHHALFMARRASQVVAFEPSASARERFNTNVRLNGIANITLFPVALGDADGEAELGSGFEANSGSRSLCWTLDRKQDETVTVRRGDTLFFQEQLPRMTILKLDVEGYEKRVLNGLRNTLRRDRPVILIELVGESVKGGFRNEAELRNSVYPAHDLFTLRGTSKARLAPFDWNGGTAICLPEERTRVFNHLITGV
jgi:FkbM family methyltransferase